MKTIKMEIPDWAEWDLKPTILEKVQQLVEELPKGHMFYSEIIHKQVIKDKNFSPSGFLLLKYFFIHICSSDRTKNKIVSIYCFTHFDYQI